MAPPAGPPTIPEDLLVWLERIYPNQVPRVTDSEREIFMKVGQVELVKTLRHFYTRQNGGNNVTEV